MTREEGDLIIQLIDAVAEKLNNQRKGLAEAHEHFEGRYQPRVAVLKAKLMDICQESR